MDSKLTIVYDVRQDTAYCVSESTSKVTNTCHDFHISFDNYCIFSLNEYN